MAVDAQTAQRMTKNLLDLSHIVRIIPEPQKVKGHDSLVEYMNLQLLFKLLGSYTCGLLCLEGQLCMVDSLNLEEAKNLK